MRGWTAWLIYNLGVMALIVTTLILTESMWAFIALLALTSYKDTEAKRNET